MDKLAEILASLPRVEILQRDERYLRATFTTKWMRYTDDVELRLDEGAGVIHIRSASRVGYGDMGVNRARAAEIARRWAER